MCVINSTYSNDSSVITFDVKSPPLTFYTCTYMLNIVHVCDSLHDIILHVIQDFIWGVGGGREYSRESGAQLPNAEVYTYF